MIVFAADLHLSPTTWASLPDLARDAYRSWEQIVDYCRVNCVDSLVLGGDVFDKPYPSSESVLHYTRGIECLRDNDISVYAIQGQHDRSNPPWMTITPHVRHILPMAKHDLECDGEFLTVYGHDNAPSEVIKKFLEEIAAVGQCDLLVLHQLLKSAIPLDGVWNLDDDWIPPFVRLVLLGDLHAPVSTGRIHYSGSMHMRRVNETPQKSFLVVRANEGQLTVERVPLATRKVYLLSARDKEGLDAAVATLSEAQLDIDPKPLVVAEISPDVPEARARLAEACGDAFFIARDLRVAQPQGSSQGLTDGGITLDTCIAEIVDREKDPELHDFLVQILKSNDPSLALAEIRQNFGIGEV